jgi:hypothetical protein
MGDFALISYLLGRDNMAQLVYTPDDDVTIHEESATKVVCCEFQSHES